jgi:circadian clock protein KaiC
VPTGVPALDETLGGGIPKGSVVFVAGKTILCQQVMWTNAIRGETIVYLSTLSEPMVKMLRFAQTFGFFRPELIGDSIIYGDLGAVLLQDGARPVLETLERLISDHRPDLLIIDSFKAMREGFERRVAFRKFASEIMQRLNTWEVTTLLVGEYDAQDIRDEAEFSIADGIIYLYGTEEAQQQKRMLRIMKMRGTDVFGGEHMFEITSHGITLFPRMSPAIVGEYEFTGLRVGSVIEGINDMAGGGVFESTSTLLASMTGAGKTLTALSFLVASAREGRLGLLVTMEKVRCRSSAIVRPSVGASRTSSPKGCWRSSMFRRRSSTSTGTPPRLENALKARERRP